MASSELEPTSEVSVPENDEDSDFEPSKAAASGRKRGGGKEAHSAIGIKRPKRGGGAGGGKGRKKEEREDTEGSLFEIVKTGKVALQSIVDDWIESYKQERDQALLQLIQFFIQCSGCRGKISQQMYETMEHAEIIRKMTEEFDEESGDYPLIMTGQQWKKFKTNFCEFVQVLVRQCQYSIIYDQYMMDNLISLLTGLTDSQVRAFRHTSTLASMKLMTALVDVALNLSINLDNAQKQYETERQKNKQKQSAERLQVLMSKRTELEENQEEIRNMLTYIFKGVFVHRYRDTQPEIRTICMQEIGVWMRKYPNMFLDDSYLKYVGWTLYDKVGQVRSDCFKTLQPLYETNTFAHKMELFTNRFKDRIVEMTLDKEYDVAVGAVRLVISILKAHESVLSDKDCENVYELVYSSHRAVAQAAGEFLNAKLFQRDDDATKSLKTKRGKKRSENTPLIRDLVQFFIESELHEHGAYLVDSLWEVNQMMKDWECMTDLLLEEPGRGEEALDDRQESCLIEIMVCCVRQAATGESPVGRGPNKKLSTKENKQILEDRTKLTEHFIVFLPQLLAKYGADAEKLANLLQIPLHFDLEIYTTSRQEKCLDLLLNHIREIIDRHTDSEVLENCSKILECFCSEEFAIAGKCDVARSTLLDALVEKFKGAHQDYFQQGDEPDEDEEYSLAAGLKRIYAFYSCHDMTGWNLWDLLFQIVKAGNDNPNIPAEIVCKAISSCSVCLMWSLQKLDENNPDKDAMKQLKKRVSDFMKLLHDLMYHQQEKVNEESYITICDLLLILSRQLGTNPVMKPLVYEPDRNLQAQLSGYLSDKVFVEDEDEEADENVKIEELHTRRNLLASFCKLVVYNVVGIKMAADMFKHYMKFYNDYGDIIKTTLGKAREINKVLTAKTLACSLTQLFKELQAQGPVDRTSDSFHNIKELARRFNLSFGLDQVKNRDAVAAMHTEGIIFSLTPLENPNDPKGAPPNLGFLEILCEFTSKLMRQDKKAVVNFLDKHLKQGMMANRSEDWQPLLMYRNSLIQDAEEKTSVTGRANTIGRPKGGRKRKVVGMDGGDASTNDAWLSKEPATPGPLGEPPMHSTAVKRRRVEDDMSDFEASSIQMSQMSQSQMSQSQMSQASWLGSQRQNMEMSRQNAANYGRRIQQSRIEEETSIGSFSSPVQPSPQQQQQQRPTRSSRGRIDPNLMVEESPQFDTGSDDLPAGLM
ncbi:cohesin subunit SA-1-like isoform X1 [Lingula anatina]|uniref:Cohesin subunit SA-1-like isoform X1 n=1 Tax=Lingula anatina TaxID=7574 RepID=A0A1S3H709_LINAN|nr:cohesin subunit SA-1-like isoform X1 [Lingula anatina]|eukprot:XP_013381266.1 cohesin subunit SA-1-like isoform X1 [Lingula anatina]